MAEKLKEWSELIVPWLMSHGLRIIIIAVAAYVLNLIITRIIIKTVRVAVVAAEGESDDAEKKREETLIRIFNGAVTIVIMMVTVMMILQEASLEIGPLLAGAGIAGLALGFGGQYLIRDIITGLFLILENQYRIGDVVNIDGTGGAVVDISLRKTTLRDLNGTVHHIPHGTITKVSNLSKDWARVNLDMGIAYDTDLDHLIEVINRTGIEMSEDPDYKDSIITPPKFLRVDEFADSAIVVKILGETKALKQWEVTGEFRKRLKKAFDKEGIEIPFPQRVIHQPQEK